MNNETRIDALSLITPLSNARKNLIKRNDDVIEVFIETKTQRKIGSRQRAGDRNRFISKFVNPHFLSGDDHGTIAVSHTRTTRAKHVEIREVCITV